MAEIKSYKAGGDIPKRRLVKLSDDDTVVVATASTDLIIGVNDNLDVSTGDTCDIYLQGVAEVEFGGTVPRGSFITADATGKAVVATGTVRIAGKTLASAVSGDVALAVL